MRESRSRRLAPFLTADIAGHSAVMGSDEARTGSDLKGYQVAERTDFEFGLSGKWLELLKQFAPRVERVAVGFLHGGSASSNSHLVNAFRRGLAETGYVEGENVVIEYRWAEGQYDRLAGLAADLVRRQATVICGSAPPAALAAKAATTTIPIVFVSGDDPIKSGLVEEFDDPGGNVTGISVFSGSQLGAKHIDLLHELVPGAAVIGLLVNPLDPTSEAQTLPTAAATQRLGLRLHVVNASTDSDFDRAFAALAEQWADALIVGGDPFFTSQCDRLVALAARHALPVVYNLREFVAAGGLMSYGGSVTDGYRQAGTYVGRILKGAKPADLAVVQPTKLELVINLKTAKTLGLTVPTTLLVAADEVIE
jgi:putative tryptophan/tyrosine transport system substrate-binding protein